jgi:hypothetical protein
MKIAVTGHTSGIGKSIYDYFLQQNNNVIGFSRSNGYDISNKEDRTRICNLSENFDIFVNNAYKNFDNSQELMLTDRLASWKDTEKIIINLSSRWTAGNHKYCHDKMSIDTICNEHLFSKVHLINLKPGLTDTPRVITENGVKLKTKSIVDIIDFILLNKNEFKIHSITFGK